MKKNKNNPHLRNDVVNRFQIEGATILNLGSSDPSWASILKSGFLGFSSWSLMIHAQSIFRIVALSIIQWENIHLRNLWQFGENIISCLSFLSQLCWSLSSSGGRVIDLWTNYRKMSACAGGGPHLCSRTHTPQDFTLKGSFRTPSSSTSADMSSAFSIASFWEKGSSHHYSPSSFTWTITSRQIELNF